MKKKIYIIIIILLVIVIIAQGCIFYVYTNKSDKDKIWMVVTSDSFDVSNTDKYTIDTKLGNAECKTYDKGEGYTLFGDYGRYDWDIKISNECIKEKYSKYKGNGVEILCTYYNTNDWHRLFIETNIEMIDENKCEIKMKLYNISDSGELYSIIKTEECSLDSNYSIVNIDLGGL